MQENKDTISSKQVKVLVVEDEIIIAINICNSLQKIGYLTEYSNSGENALTVFSTWNPDIILMDIMLGSGMDGVETAEKIHKTSNVPIIYLTAYSDQATLSRAKITDPFGYLIKPFHGRELFIAIEMAIYKNKSIQSFKDIQHRLFESQKLESIGLLSSGISHEINNPLMSIINFSILGEEDALKINNPKMKKYFEVIRIESERISTVVKNLMNYSREDKDFSNWIYIEELMQDSLALFKQLLIRDNISIDLILEEDLPKVFCNSQKIKQIILNLISCCRSSVLAKRDNANKYIQIKIKKKSKENEDYVQLIFENSGIYIPENPDIDINKLYNQNDQNYSTSDLGYYLSMGIVAEHNGSILTKIVDNHTNIIIDLPVSLNERISRPEYQPEKI
ncbi:MAG: hybrid sensor histidine kinase/response regulator [Leptospira sp.]|jgi:two-component system, NtrC family, sensor kinase|nr:hybrid sensor histidine kinase/response regulator [Leptospira sp.]NCS93528.1 hybrid sensor histidine kinase/response regulator [Leptospira sp.]